ncbi:FAD:protein FMN transferase [Planctomycetes bacterium K23_9]|uniref:FAD:protein FMN transferase n=1 Tax=Stieleria marina TaxID=1930275 RepID=A0A517NPN3_9BACT|nr:Thiamine biosynthesis lipoprotein ApbE precursor [Planctomycetes bacterium K23_9]
MTDPGILTTLTHRAMATEFVVLLPAHEAAKADGALEALEMVDQIESDLTIYQPTSQIAAVNREASRGPVSVSPSVFGILQRAIHWSRQTDGAFDISAGPLVQAWGFTKRTGRKPSAQEIQTARACVGFEHLILDEARQTVEFGLPGMSINLGGIGKGYALDQLAQKLESSGIENFLLHGGQSSVVARGDQTHGSEQGWAVGIAHPTKPQRRAAGIWLHNMALGTSGSGKQFFHHQGRRYGHVIDPRTGFPAGDLLSLTVLTRSAADADAGATGYFVAGSQVIANLHSESASQRSADSQRGMLDDGMLGVGMLAIAPAKRQDEIQLQSYGKIDWVQD